DGHTPTEEELLSLVRPAVEKAVRELPERVSVAKTLIDQTGSLVELMTDGSTREVGPVVGRDGRDGQDVDMPAVLERIDEVLAKKVEALPKPRDGEDGLGFDDLEVVQHDDFRTLTLRFAQGDKIKSYDAHFPVVIYRGIFREGEKYAVGD